MRLVSRINRRLNPGRLADAIAHRLGARPYESLREELFGLLVRGVYADAAEFRFVQVGGFDGTSNDYLHEFLVGHTVRGVIVEPQQEAFDKLSAVYQDHPQIVPCRAAIADKPGQAKMYKVADAYRCSPAGEMVPHSIASLDPEHPAKYMRKHADWLPRNLTNDELLTSELVETLDMRSLLAQYELGELELLFVDAEGFDGEVVRQTLEVCKPRMVNFEHKGLPRRERMDLWQFLSDKGYRLAAHRGDLGDTVALV